MKKVNIWIEKNRETLWFAVLMHGLLLFFLLLIFKPVYETNDDMGISQMVNGVKCNIYAFTYRDPLAVNEETEAAAFVGFYLDKNVNIKDNKVYLNGEFTGYEGTKVNIEVKAQAVYAEADESKETLMEVLNKMTTNPWATTNNETTTPSGVNQ